ncbi:hypothetical protein K443DRAFT_13236 [Laccaria amethystina LaAM-08-1]|uniref:Uncharacterized protein n=1 Tax=Laccaria amethystina LaAM-08-1 TaxID=1095629 RepID=A0A0C9WIH1_9AGAR|nr:hypothetical protein K443DRAFT_13236 [Laccaria amethystina LaAM-08-1]
MSLVHDQPQKHEHPSERVYNIWTEHAREAGDPPVTLTPPKSPHYHPPILHALTNEHSTSQATASSLPSNRAWPHLIP